MRLLLLLLLVVTTGCYWPSLSGLQCNEDHPCADGWACLRNICVEVGAGACASDADCPSNECDFSVCSGSACSGCSGWTGTCFVPPGEGEGEEGEGEEGEGEEGEGEEGEGEGEGEPDPCGLELEENVVEGSLTVDNAATLVVLAGQGGVNGDLRVELDEDTDLQALADLTGVNGDLIVDGPFTDLAPLSSLRCVAGSLVLRRTSSVLLPLLDAVPGDLVVEDTALPDLAGLDALRVVGGDVVVEDTGLSSLTGLSGLVSIGGSLRFVSAAGDARSFLGLTALSSVGTLLVDESQPASLAGLTALTRVTNRLEVRAAPLTTLSLPALERAGAVVVEDAPALTGLGGLSALTTIDEELSVVDAPGVVDFAGLSRLNRVGTLALDDRGPPSLAGLGGLRTIVNDLVLDGSDVTDLAPLANVVVGGDIEVRGCERLTALALARAQGTVGGSLLLVDVPALADISALRGVQEVFGDVQVVRTGLTSLQDLAALSVVYGDVVVDDNAALADASLPSLQEVRRDVEITQAQALTTLDGLARLTAIGGSLVIEENAVLSSVQTLRALRLGGAVRIRDNPELKNCEAETLAIELGRTVDEIGDNNGDGCFCGVPR